MAMMSCGFFHDGYLHPYVRTFARDRTISCSMIPSPYRWWQDESRHRGNTSVKRCKVQRTRGMQPAITECRIVRTAANLQPPCPDCCNRVHCMVLCACTHDLL